jgi:hypothetical protein
MSRSRQPCLEAITCPIEQSCGCIMVRHEGQPLNYVIAGRTVQGMQMQLALQLSNNISFSLRSLFGGHPESIASRFKAGFA